MESSRILITGNLGFIGSHLHDLYPSAVGWDLESDAYPQEDITEPLPEMDFTHIFHLAASKSVSNSEKLARQYIINNCWGTVNIMKAYPNARIINISSSAANECKSIYGMTKYFAELAGDNHKNCLNVRLYNVFGEGQGLDYAPVVPNFIKAKMDKSPAIIYGDGSQTRDLTYVGDVVHELNRLMFATKDTGLHHLGYGNPISILDLCHQICGEDADIRFLPKRSFDIEHSCAMTPMQMTYGREIGLKRTIEWWEDKYRANPPA